jgi:hypothetical protein
VNPGRGPHEPRRAPRLRRCRKRRRRAPEQALTGPKGVRSGPKGGPRLRWCRGVGADAMGGQNRGAGTQRGGSAHRRAQRGLSRDEWAITQSPRLPRASRVIPVVRGRSALRREATVCRQNKGVLCSPSNYASACSRRGTKQ